MGKETEVGMHVAEMLTLTCVQWRRSNQQTQCQCSSTNFMFNRCNVQKGTSRQWWVFTPERSPDIVCATFIHIEQYWRQWRRDCKGLAHEFYMCVFSPSVMFDLLTLWTAVHQALLSIGFSRQNYWNGLPFSIARDFPISGVNPHLLLLWLW